MLSVLSHVAEVYPASLAEAVAPSEEAEGSQTPKQAPVPILDLMQPAVTLLCGSTHKSHFAAVFDHLLEPLLLACDNVATTTQKSKKRKFDEGDADFARVLSQPLCDTKGQTLQPADVQPALLKIIFEAASNPKVSDANRRRLYALCRQRMPEDQPTESIDAADA